MWLGRADMYYSSLPVATNDSLLGKVGSEIEFAETVTEHEEGEGPAAFHWVIARKSTRDEPDAR